MIEMGLDRGRGYKGIESGVAEMTTTLNLEQVREGLRLNRLIGDHPPHSVTGLLCV